MANRYDVNNDGQVNITDAMIVVDQVLGKPIPNKDIDVKGSIMKIASALRDVSNSLEDILSVQDDEPENVEDRLVEVTDAELSEMLENESWVENVIYYTVEE